MTQECCNLLHLHGLVAGGAEAQWLVNCSCSDERLIVPESNCVCHGRISLGKEILELVGLEVIGDGQITTELGPFPTFPPFFTKLLPLHILHQRLRVVIPIHQKLVQHYQSEN